MILLEWIPLAPNLGLKLWNISDWQWKNEDAQLNKLSIGPWKGVASHWMSKILITDSLCAEDCPSSNQDLVDQVSMLSYFFIRHWRKGKWSRIIIPCPY